jgi:hypothetical protein
MQHLYQWSSCNELGADPKLYEHGTLQLLLRNVKITVSSQYAANQGKDII